MLLISALLSFQKRMKEQKLEKSLRMNSLRDDKKGEKQIRAAENMALYFILLT